MVEALGPQSYLAITFEDCFELALCNIESDLHDSMKSRWKRAEQRLAELNQETTEEINFLKEQIRERNTEIKNLKERMPSVEAFIDYKDLANFYLKEAQRKVKIAEDTILKNADQPETEAFQNAVKERKGLLFGIECTTGIIEELERQINLY